MLIIVNSSNNIEIGETTKAEISAAVEQRLGRFSERLTRIEAFIEDENGSKSGLMDKRCMLEARPEGMSTINVVAHGASVNEAVKSATHKLERRIDHTFGRLGTIPGHGKQN